MEVSVFFCFCLFFVADLQEMWRLSKRKTLALAGLVLSGCMYLAAHTHFFLAVSTGKSLFCIKQWVTV